MENRKKTVEYRIMLRPEEIQSFVGNASGCDFDIDIAYNSYVVDAKSILGVMGLDLSRVLTVVCHGYSKEFDSYLKGLAEAC